MGFLKSKILGGAALAVGLSFALPQSTLISLGPDKAQAAVDISINVGTFYDRLAPYGDWMRRGNTYVFVPAVGPGWRPYTLGHWDYTDRFGWIWVSDEPFGWAAYHYGRWGFDDDLGWYWVPATQWAPAWVSWRRSNDYVAWAPLPPDRDSGLDINIDVDSDRYWAVVPAPQFLAGDFGRIVIRQGDTRFRTVFREMRPLGRVNVANRLVVNNFINVNDIERATRKRVRVKQVREINDVARAGRANSEDDAVAVFAPQVEKRANEKPRDLKSVEDVSRKRKNPQAQGANQLQGQKTTGQGENQIQIIRPRPLQQDVQGQGQDNGQAPGKRKRELQQGEDNTGGGVTIRKNQQVQQSDQGGQVLKRKPDRNEKAFQQLQGNQPGPQPGNQDQIRKPNKKCQAGAQNCPG
jgi:hypothetical protein